MKRLALAVTAATVVVGASAVRAGGWPDFGGVAWGWLAAAYVTMAVANLVVCGLRWRVLAGPVVSAGRAVRLYAEAAVASTVLPFSGDVIRARHGRLPSVVTDRLVGGAVIATAAGVAVAASPALRSRAVVVAVFGLGFVVAAVGWSRFTRALPSASAVAGGVALSFLYVGLCALGFGLLFRAVGVPVGPATVLAATPLVLLGASVPSVSGIGLGLVVLAWCSHRLGAGAAQTATLLSLLVGAQVAMCAPGTISLAVTR